MSRAPRFEVKTTMHFEKSTRRLSPSVRVALSRIPSRSSERVRGFFDLVKQHQGQLQIVIMHPIKIFLRQHRRGLAVTKVSWRRANELGNLVRVLEFSAVNLHDCVHIGKEYFSRRFNYTRLAG